MSKEQNKQTVINFIDAIQRNDVPAVIAQFHDEATIRTMGSTPLSGTMDKSTLASRLKEVRGAFPDGMDMKLHGLIAEGESVAAEAESYGRHASGNIYNNKFHFLFHFKDAKIFEMKEYLDTEHVVDALCGEQRSPVA